MSGRIDRFKKRKEIIKSNQSLPLISGVVDQESVDALFAEGVNHQRLGELDHTTDCRFTLEVDPEEVKSLLLDLRSEFNEKRVEQLLEETKNGIVSSIVGPFGLGKLMSAYDKEGGNVTTVNNANNGVYANDDDTYKREEYTNSKNSDGNQFAGLGKSSAGSNFTKSKMDENGIVQDAYTGQSRSANTTSPDHIESLSQHHKNGGFMQVAEKKSDFATDENNLALTERSINQSMRDFEKDEWARKKTGSDIENKDKFEIDDEKLKEQVARGKATSANHLPSDMVKARYYVKNSMSTGLNEGAKLGAQQAFGVLLVEFFSASFSEIRLAFNKGLEGESLYSDIKIRLGRIGRKVTKKWKDAIKGFSGGFISGFLSNLITTLINVFVTTGKRVVRMIREGVFSLLKALKLIMFPPADMSYQEAVHEAMKLIAAGGIVVVGVLLEESIEKLVFGVPFLAPFATIVTAVIVGSLTAMAMSLVTYLIDKMDLLGVIKIEETKYILNGINGSIGEALKRCESVTEDIDGFLYQDTPLLPAGS
jgi:hypothetical protein